MIFLINKGNNNIKMEVKEFFYDKSAAEELGAPEFVKPKKKESKSRLVEEIENYDSEVIRVKVSKKKKTDLTEEINELMSKYEKKTISKKNTQESIRGSGIRLSEEECEMTDFDLKSVKFSGAILDYACLEGVEIETKYFIGIVYYIYEFLEELDVINENTIMNIKPGKEIGKGFKHLESLDISIQGVTSDKAINEIFNQVIGNDLTFQMNIITTEKKFIFKNNDI